MINCFAAKAQNSLPPEERPGEVSYQIIPGAADAGEPDYYHFTFKMVIDCDYPAPKLLPFFINDFDNSANSQSYVWAYDSASNQVNVADPCIAFSYPPCYRIYYFHCDVVLPYNNGGYSLFFPDCCRDNYQNIRIDNFNKSSVDGQALGTSWSGTDGTRPSVGYDYNGILYIINLPSRKIWRYNGSPVFNNSSDTILNVCKNDTFSHTFGAVDPDGDSLVYSFSPAKTFFVKPTGVNVVSIQTSGSTLSLIYKGPEYTEGAPLGDGVSIDPATGYMHGRLHDTGSYLVTVGVDEYRAGEKVTSTPHTRDVVIKVFDCSTLPIPQAILPPLVNSCLSNVVILPDSSIPYHPELTWDNNKYLWKLGDGATSNQRYPFHTYDTGTYNVQLITMPGYRCADTANMKLIVYPALKPAFFINGAACTGLPIKFTNTTTTDIGSINNLKWTFTNLKDSTSFTSTLSSPVYTFKVPDQSYSAILDVTTNKGCEGKDTQYLNIRLAPLPLPVHDTVITSGYPYTIQANAGYDTTGGTYSWSPSTGLDNPFASNPVATGTQDITYRVQETNANGCSLTDTIHLTYYKGPDIYLPDAFTPNGDGKNDVFKPFPVGILKLEYFRVYNRWGNIVYQTQTYLAGWNGNINGRQAPTGTYIYEARGKDYNNKTVFKKGHVLLLR